MTQEERLKKISEIESVSPLEISKNLIDIELYDIKSSQAVLDEIYEQFESKESVVDEVLIPCMFTVADGIFAGLGVKKSKLIGGAGNKGLSPSRFANEVKNFNYKKDLEESHFQNDLLEYQQLDSKAREIGVIRANKEGRIYNQKRRKKDIEDIEALNKYKKKHFKNEKNEVLKTANDEYDPNSKIYLEEKNPDKRLKEGEKHKKQANTDHILSLSASYEKYRTNIALDDVDIKAMLNQDDNFAVTAQGINNPKSDKTIKELLKLEKEKPGSTGIEIKVLKEIEKKSKQAQKSTDKEGSKRISKNLLDKNRAGKIHKEVGKQAIGQAKNMAMGDIAMMMVTPITYEACDSFKNGLHEGVGAGTPVEGIKVRVKRVVNYIVEKMKKFKFKITDIIKQLLNSFVNGIINLFLGVYKIIGKAIIKGAKSLIEAFKICFGKDSKKLSKAEKADAILKVVGGLVTGIFGFLIEDLIDNILPDELSIPFSMIITGILTTVVTYYLDKMDLFSVKAEKRHNAVKKIFNERINNVKKAVELFDEKAIETLRKQQCLHSNISNNMNQAFENDDIDLINENIQDLSKFFGVKLEYSTTDEFVDYFDSNKTVVI